MTESYRANPSEPPDWLPFPNAEIRATRPPMAHAVPRSAAAPQIVQAAVRLMFTRIVLAVVSLLALYAGKAELRAAIVARYPGYQLTGVDRAVTSMLTLTAFSTVLFAFIYSSLASRVSRGNRRARTRTMVLAAFAIVVATFVGFGRPMPQAPKFLTLVDVLVDIAIIACLASGPSAEYFARRR